MKKKLLAYALLPVLGLSALGIGAGVASAHGLFGGEFMTLSSDDIATRQNQMFQNEATLLGLSVDDVKAAWAKGQSLQELATAKGISQSDLQARIKAARDAQMKTQMQALVTKGVITQAQADARLATMAAREQKMGKGPMSRRFGRGLGF